MLIGREKEKQILQNALHEEYSQFIAVYGRRRVGKTFLIRESFNYQFAFQLQVRQTCLQRSNWLVSEMP